MREKNARKRLTFKERFPYFWLEILILVIIGIFVVMVVQTQNVSIKTAYDAHIEQIHDTISDLSWQGIDQETIMAELYYNNLFSEYTGFALEFYDIDGNVVAKPRDDEIWIYWDSSASDFSKIFFLEDYFTEEQLQPLYEINTTTELGLLEVAGLIGYYNTSGEFVLNELQFWHYDQTSSAEPEYIKIKNKLPDSVTEDILYIFSNGSNANETGKGLLEIVQRNEKMDQRAYKKLQAVEKYWVDSLNTSFINEVPGTSSTAVDRYVFSGAAEVMGSFYRIAVVYAPVKMILMSHTFWWKVIPLVILCQGGALVFFIYQRESRNKKKKMEQMQHTFLNAMAHEMKTPAAVIKNGTECIKENIHPEKNEHYLDMISKEADHLNELLSKMLIFTRTNEGAYSLQKERLSLETLVNAVLPSYQLAMEFKGISINVQAEDAKEICGDEQLLKMVIDNFISNGIRYGNENSQMVVRIANRGLSVYNEGEVLSVEDQKRIWEPLYIVDAARSKNDGSAGMGLAICKNVLELHHARYGVENVDGGVRFFFELPE